jgi:hypothetical protein
MANTGRCGRVLETPTGILKSMSLLAAVAIVAGGCSRGFYRRAADKEVNGILAEKDKYPQWKIGQYHVYADPRARFADSTNPDRPPMPPDDPAAWNMTPHSQRPGHAGTAWVEGTGYLEILHRWDEENRAEEEALAKKEAGTTHLLVVPDDPAIRGMTGDPALAPKPFLIRLEQAVELGVINAREHQDLREALYLAALPVTQQRFSFAFQWAATENAIRQFAGAKSVEGSQNNWTLVSTPSFSKLFSTGALLTMSFANTTVFNFLNLTHSTTSVSLMNLDLVQPLLQGGGRAVTLEPLTQSERNLVYDIRGYARFREQFYASLVIGTTLPSGLPVTTSGGLSVVTTSPISILAALGLASTDMASEFRGFFPTLFRELDMTMDKKLVADLEKAVELFEGLQEGGQVSPLQVDQARGRLLTGRNTVLSDIQNVNNAMDQFKLQLGLPTNIPLLLDDTPARPITRQFERYYEVLLQADTAFKLVDKQSQLPPEKMRAFLLEVFSKDPLVQGTEFRNKAAGTLARWSKDKGQDLKKRLRELGEERRRLLDLKTKLEMERKVLPAADTRRLEETEFESDVGGLEEALRRYESQPWQGLKDEAKRRQLRATEFLILAREAQVVLVWARRERLVKLRTLWPTLPPVPLQDLNLLTADVNLAQQEAIKAALTNRVDLMNARAQVVDAWRQIRVTANALMGVLTPHYHMDVTTPIGGSHALAFSSAGTNQSLTINAQLPLNRVAQRNVYRTAVINYQSARRSLMAVEDNIAAQVRFDVRQLHLFAENYKIQQRVIELDYSVLENSLEVLVAPPDPTQLTASTTTGAANAATFTNQYLTALSGLNGDQTKMYDIWLSYLATRMQLYLDLEMLTLDSRGVWTDELATGSDLSASPDGSSGGGNERTGAGQSLPAARILDPIGISVRPARLLPPAEATPVE